MSPRLRPHANIEEKRGSEGGSKGGIQRNKIGEWKRKRQTNERDRWIPCSCGYKREILSPKFISPSESTSGSEISRCKALEGGCGALAAGDPVCAPQEGQNLRPGCRPSAPQAAHMRLLPAVSVSYAGGGISISAPIVGASIYGKKQKRSGLAAALSRCWKGKDERTMAAAVALLVLACAVQPVLGWGDLSLRACHLWCPMHHGRAAARCLPPLTMARARSRGMGDVKKFRKGSGEQRSRWDGRGVSGRYHALV